MIGPWHPAAPSTIERWVCLFCGRETETHGSRRGWAWRRRTGEDSRRGQRAGPDGLYQATDHACPSCVRAKSLEPSGRKP